MSERQSPFQGQRKQGQNRSHSTAWGSPWLSAWALAVASRQSSAHLGAVGLLRNPKEVGHDAIGIILLRSSLIKGKRRRQRANLAPQEVMDPYNRYHHNSRESICFQVSGTSCKSLHQEPEPPPSSTVSASAVVRECRGVRGGAADLCCWCYLRGGPCTSLLPPLLRILGCLRPPGRGARIGIGIISGSGSGWGVPWLLP